MEAKEEQDEIEWRDLPKELKFSNYTVSSNGQIRNTRGCILNTKPRSTGYIYATLVNDEKQSIVIAIHVLVAHAFIPPDDTKSQIDHINGNRSDNRLVNLRRVTPQGNALNRNHPGRKGKLLKQLDDNNETIKIWHSLHEAARALGVTPSAISNCCTGKTNSAAGYNWEYMIEIEEGEEWRQVTAGDTTVEVSSIGRVKLTYSISYGRIYSAGKGVGIKDKEGKEHHYPVHELVCRAFNGDAPSPHMHVLHIDENRSNNRIENLKWATMSEIVKSSQKPRKHTSWGRAVEQYTVESEHIATYKSITIAAKISRDLTTSNICDCCRGRSREAGGYIWKYAKTTEFNGESDEE